MSAPKNQDWESINRNFAKKLNKISTIHALYGALDGLSLSYSFLNYAFSVVCTNTNPSDEMHNWMSGPEGGIATAMEAVSIIAFSLMGNLFRDDDPNVFKRYAAALWPFVRDALKGTKNAYKGVRSTLQSLAKITGNNLNVLILPLGLSLGALSIVNRIFTRAVVEEPRKQMMKENAELLQEVQASATLVRLKKLPENTKNYINRYILIDKTLYYIDFNGIKGVVYSGESGLEALEGLFNEKTFNAPICLSKEIKEAITHTTQHRPKNSSLYLIRLELLPDTEEIKRYKNKYILVGNILYYIDSKGHQSAVSEDASLISRIEHFLSEKMTFSSSVYLNEEQYNNFIIAPYQHKPPPLSIQSYQQLIKKQSPRIAKIAKWSKAYGGFVDGLYLFLGALTLSAFVSLPIFIVLSAISGLFVALCMMTRVYEEHEYQRRLKCTQVQIEMALYGKKSAELFKELNENTSLSDEERQQLSSALFDALDTYAKKREVKRSLMTLSMPSMVLEGLKNGLAAYSALSSIMFAVSICLLLSGVSFPPALLAAFVLGGLVCLLVFLTHSLIKNFSHKQSEEDTDDIKSEDLEQFIASVKKRIVESRSLRATDIEKNTEMNISSGMVVDPSPQFFFQEWFEVFRSFFSGMGKGRNAITYMCNSLQDVGNDGHYVDSPVMVGFAGVTAVAYALTLAARAYCKNISRDRVYQKEKMDMQPLNESCILEQYQENKQEDILKTQTPSPDVEEHPVHTEPSPVLSPATPVVSSASSSKNSLGQSKNFHCFFSHSPEDEHEDEHEDELEEPTFDPTKPRISPSMRLPSPVRPPQNSPFFRPPSTKDTNKLKPNLFRVSSSGWVAPPTPPS